MMKGIFTLVFCLGVSYVFGQATGDYRSAVNGGSWHVAGSWQVFTAGPGPGTGWNTAVAPPTNLSAVITIRNGFNIVQNSGATIFIDETVVEAGALLTIASGSQLSVQAGLGEDLTINGTVQNNGTLRANQAASLIAVYGTLNSAGTMSNMAITRLRFNSGSLYTHQNSGATSIPPATWIDNSTIRITGNVTDITGGLTQSFYNFEWNTSTLSNPVSLTAGTSLIITVRHDLSIVNTGGSRLYFSQDNEVTVNVGNDFTIGTAGRVGFNVDGSTTVNVVNNFTVNSTASGNLPTGGSYGGGSVDINATNVIFGPSSVFDASGSDVNEGLSGSGTTTFAITGNYASAGTFRNTGTAPGLPIRFTGAATHSFTSTAVPTIPVNFSVEDTGNLDIAATSRLAGSGTLAVASGARITLRSVSTNGAYRTTVAAGNVQVTGTRTINGTIVYGGTARQFMFAETPDVATVIANSGNVDVRESVTFTTGMLTLQTGLLRIANGSTLTVANLAYGTGAFGYAPTSNLVLNGTGNIDLRLTAYSGSAMNNLTINRAGTVTQTTASLRINGTLALSNGTLAMTNRTLQVYGPLTAAVGAALSSTAGSLYVRGAGAIPSTVPLSGTLNIFEMDRATETLTTTGALTITRLNLYGG
ncbi:MAG TPA: hypothetical protein VK658_02030, partial [Chryseolinea sp.]|nr:hypothetical protein [Chryseolinea sp.]